MSRLASILLVLSVSLTLSTSAEGFGWRSQSSYSAYYPSYYQPVYSYEAYSAAPAAACAAPVAVPVPVVVAVPAAACTVPVPTYAQPTPAPPSGSDEPAPRPQVSTTRSYYAGDYVARTSLRVSDGLVPVGFWNVTGRDILLRVDGETVVVPADRSVTVQLPRQFLWSVDGRGAEASTVPAGRSSFEIVIRR